jgi:hypothetical protein
MELADEETRLTHVVVALSISDQLLGDSLSCHVCTVSESHYLTPEVTFPVKTAPSVGKKVLDAAKGQFCSTLHFSSATSQRGTTFG